MAEVIDAGQLTLKITRHEYSLILEALHLSKSTLQWSRHQGNSRPETEDDVTRLIADLANGSYK